MACFQIVLHIKDLDLLYKISEFFGGVGSVTTHKDRLLTGNLFLFCLSRLDLWTLSRRTLLSGATGRHNHSTVALSIPPRATSNLDP